MRGVKMKRLSPVQLMEAVREVIEDGTGLECCSDPDGKESPFYAVEFVGSAPVKSKTMRLDGFSLLVHCIDVPSTSQVGVLGMVNALEEAMEACPCLPAVRSDTAAECTGVDVHHLMSQAGDGNHMHAVGPRVPVLAAGEHHAEPAQRAEEIQKPESRSPGLQASPEQEAGAAPG